MEAIFTLLAVILIAAVVVALVFLIWFLWTRIGKAGGDREAAVPETPHSPVPGSVASADGKNPLESKPKRNGFKSPSGVLLLRLGMSGLLALAMLIPSTFILNLAQSRRTLRDRAVSDIGNEWGGHKTVAGPVFVIPYLVTREVEEKIPLLPVAPTVTGRGGAGGGETRENEVPPAYTTVTKKIVEKNFATLTAENLKITGDLKTETRKRGIHETLVYTAYANFSGEYRRPDFSLLDDGITSVLWEEARLAVFMNDTMDLKRVSDFSFAGRETDFTPGVKNLGFATHGFSAAVDLSGLETAAFSFDILFTGSGLFQVAPAAKNSEIRISSEWPHPSFTGMGLPVERVVDENGFSALWTVPNLARSYPDFGDAAALFRPDAQNREPFRGDYAYPGDGRVRGGTSDNPFMEYPVGVRLVNPLEHHVLVQRAVKYSLLFTMLTFLCFILFEKPGSGKLGATQLALIALSLALFYLTLLSLSEHLRFSLSFFAAASATVIMNAAYVYLSLKKARDALLMAVDLSVLYAALYAILNQEDYALLSGSVLLTIALGALMFKTRNLAREGAAADRGEASEESVRGIGATRAEVATGASPAAGPVSDANTRRDPDAGGVPGSREKTDDDGKRKD
ncbi:MAG: cell envelope integrity protein CreD [Deltaproteobacteria bacterium]|jgi:inner membrane protein|nr:cell envelope integrity protein CreD [Deltaproteobacteria bacterium]